MKWYQYRKICNIGSWTKTNGFDGQCNFSKCILNEFRWIGNKILKFVAVFLLGSSVFFSSFLYFVWNFINCSRSHEFQMNTQHWCRYWKITDTFSLSAVTENFSGLSFRLKCRKFAYFITTFTNLNTKILKNPSEKCKIGLIVMILCGQAW